MVVNKPFLTALAVLFVLGVFGFFIVPVLVGLVKLLLGLVVIAGFIGVGYYAYRQM